jgi:hypothetical protein
MLYWIEYLEKTLSFIHYLMNSTSLYLSYLMYYLGSSQCSLLLFTQLSCFSHQKAEVKAYNVLVVEKPSFCTPVYWIGKGPDSAKIFSNLWVTQHKHMGELMSMREQRYGSQRINISFSLPPAESLVFKNCILLCWKFSTSSHTLVSWCRKKVVHQTTCNSAFCNNHHSTFTQTPALPLKLILADLTWGHRFRWDLLHIYLIYLCPSGKFLC